MTKLTAVTVVALMAGGTAMAGPKGLVAHYTFDEGQGDRLEDHSGQGNHGKILKGARWVKGPSGGALEFDGLDDYVDCGKAKSLNIASGGTVMVWCRPKTLQGGLVNWSTSGAWGDERLVLAINTYHGGDHPLGVMADGSGSAGFSIGSIEPGVWNHLAITFDGETLQVYSDGLLIGVGVQSVTPEIADVPMWIGRCLGLGKQFFHGTIDEVRVYNRAVSAGDIADHYRKEGAHRGKDLSVFERLQLTATAYPAPGRILVTADSRAMRFAYDVARIRVTLHAGESSDAVRTAEATKPSITAPSELVLDVQDLPPGPYIVRAVALDGSGRPQGKPGDAAVKWTGVPKEFKNIRILNNLCWELLETTGGAANADSHTYTVPIDRWVFFRTTADVPAGGEVRMTLQDDPIGRPVAVHKKGGTLEAMRYLKAGRHALRAARKNGGTVKQVTVRAIPALQHAFFNTKPHIAAYGTYDWKFLEKDVLPNVNVMIAGGPTDAEIKAWKDSGRSWIGITNIYIPGFKADAPNAVETVFKHWSTSAGYQHPLMDGAIVDEFGGGDGAAYDIYRQAVERLNTTFPGRIYMPYGGRFYNNDRSTGFARAALAGGGYVCPEHYLIEKPSRAGARQFIQESILSDMPRWRKGIPGVVPRIIIVLGYMSHPTESLNVNPSVDYKVYMDMQVRALATHPSCFGLGGIQEYHSAYCDEENVRWAGRLYRHYCIEGNTGPATDDPYVLTHLRNPDFAQGTKGWTIQPAEPGGIRTGEHSGYSWLQARYPRVKMGDTFLITRRGAKKPNAFGREINDLTPGRLYSMKMITADYRDLVDEKSDEKRNAVSIRLDNVDVSTEPTKNFQFTYANCYAHHLGKFNAKYKYYMNYHWRVFRAKGATAQLTVTDWESDTKPGGPIGQEVMYNFIEVQPYIGD